MSPRRGAKESASGRFLDQHFGPSGASRVVQSIAGDFSCGVLPPVAFAAKAGRTHARPGAHGAPPAASRGVPDSASNLSARPPGTQAETGDRAVAGVATSQKSASNIRRSSGPTMVDSMTVVPRMPTNTRQVALHEFPEFRGSARAEAQGQARESATKGRLARSVARGPPLGREWIGSAHAQGASRLASRSRSMVAPASG